MDHLQVSVIIPVYNAEKHLEKCLNSISESRHSNIEIICVNDGSSDGSGEILNQCAKSDHRIKIITQENLGQGVARNRGLEIATGHAVHFCDADDIVHPEMYIKMFNCIKCHNADVVCAGTKITYEAHSELASSDEEYYCLKYSGEFIPQPYMLTSIDVAVWNKLFKRSFLIENKIYFPKHQYEDISFFWLWFFRCKKIYFWNEKLYNYVRRDGSFMSGIYSGRAYKIQNDILELMSTTFKNLKKFNSDEIYEFYYWDFFLGMINFHFTNHKESYKKILGSKAKKYQWLFVESLKYMNILKKYNEVLKWAEDEELIPNSNKIIISKLYTCGLRIGNIEIIKNY